MQKFFSIHKNCGVDYVRYTVYLLGIKFNFKRKFTFKSNPIIAQIAYAYSSASGISSKVIKDEIEHQRNIDDLKKGLNISALQHLQSILNRINTILHLVRSNNSFEDEKIYSKDELSELSKANEMYKNIKEENGYFSYLDYILPRKSFHPSVFVYKHGMDGLKTFQNIGDKVILDVGTCMGDSILVFRKYTDNQIIGFEPVKATHQLALQTMNLNHIDNVKIENMALGDKDDKIEISVFPDQPEWASIACRPSNNKEEVVVRSLDSYVKENNIKVGLIKVDVEGFEPSFLKGAVNTLKEQKPILLLSIYHNYHDFYKLKPWIENLNLGYKFDFFKGIDGDPVGETLLICEVY